MTMTIRRATIDDAPRITDSYNQGIAERGATFETEPRTVDSIRARIEESERFPLLAAEDGGHVLGWAGLSSHRARACCTGIEFSINLDRSARGHGIGRQLLEALVAAARERGCWKLLSRVPVQHGEPRALSRVRISRSWDLREARTARWHMARRRAYRAPHS
jgi:phosphinothricin acetyltransferase